MGGAVVGAGGAASAGAGAAVVVVVVVVASLCLTTSVVDEGPGAASALRSSAPTDEPAAPHPDSGRTALYVNWGYTESIDGWWPNESQPLLDHLFDVATNPVYTCRFRWQPGSVAIWDNRCTLHNPMSDYASRRREMWRLTIQGEEPIPGA